VASILVADILPDPLDGTRLVEMARNACRLTGREPARAFLVQLDAAVRQRMEELLAGLCHLVSAGSRSEAVATLSARRFDVVLLDVALLDGGAQELLELVGSARVLLLSAGEPATELARRVSRGLLDAPGAEAQLGEVLSRLCAGVGTPALKCPAGTG
jgi:CheY-like chemotaxis protein